MFNLTLESKLIFLGSSSFFNGSTVNISVPPATTRPQAGSGAGRPAPTTRWRPGAGATWQRTAASPAPPRDASGLRGSDWPGGAERAGRGDAAVAAVTRTGFDSIRFDSVPVGRRLPAAPPAPRRRRHGAQRCRRPEADQAYDGFH